MSHTYQKNKKAIIHADKQNFQRLFHNRISIIMNKIALLITNAKVYRKVTKKIISQIY